MTKNKFSALFFTFLILNFGINAQVFRTSISSIFIDGVKTTLPIDSEIEIDSNQILTFHFTNDFENRSDTTIYYELHLNDRVISAKQFSDTYTFRNLSVGKYKFSIQAFNGNKQESVPVVKLFSVTKADLPENKSNNFLLHLSSLELILSALFIISLIVILILFRTRGAKGPDKSKISLADDVLDEVSELRSSNKNLKTNYKLLEEDNTKLKKSIASLNKSIMLLEEANLNLLEQKESLIEKKVKLEDLQKQKDELFAIKFHDIKNPASAIKGLIELLESYDLTATEQQEIMESIMESSSSILDLVQEISVSFAKESYDDDYVMRLSLLQDVVQSVMTINSAYAKKKQIRLLNNSSSSMPEFHFDPQKIKEAIDNLVNNAIKYSLPNTDVTIRTFLTETKVVVEVKDNGVGLPQNEIGLLFKKGVKLSPVPTGGEKSSGLGLWIVKKIIEAHGGTIKVESRLGIGSKFIFELHYKID